jgi:PAS domain S-box-containing protein
MTALLASGTHQSDLRALANDRDLTSGEQSLLDAVPGAIVVVDAAGLVNGWNKAAEELFGVRRSVMLGHPLVDHVPYQLRAGNGADIRAALDQGRTWTGTATASDSSGAPLELRFTAAPLRGADSRGGHLIVVQDTSRAIHAGRSSDASEARFRGFVAAAPGLAFIKDGEGHYLFANDHAIRLMGGPLGPVWRGRTDDELWPSAVAAQIRDSDATALVRGSPVEYELILSAPDGIHTVLMSTFPLRGASGERLLGSVGLDVTDRVRTASEARLKGDRRDALRALERAAVADTLVHLRAVVGIDDTAAAICRAIHSLPRLTLASILLFEMDGSGTPIGVAAATGRPRALPRLRQAHTRALRLRAADGPWIEAWTSPNRHPHSRTLRLLGIRHVAYAPIQSGDDLVGVLMVAGSAEIGEEELAGLLPAISEFAGLAGALLGPGMPGRLGYRTKRNHILSVIAKQAFHPVFQPITELRSGVVLGYEALTRFDDGVDPRLRFADADEVDLGLKLEVATLRAALLSARSLPPDVLLSLNVSPKLLLSGGPLRSLLRRHQGEVVCEVTEHEAIADYPAFRAMAARLPGVRLAIDDVGAGFASFRHILELRPAFVKLDRSLVAGIDGDPIRRELIGSIGSFVQAAGCRLIAEGIETDAELATLQELGVPLGQGYLLGRPARLIRHE